MPGVTDMWNTDSSLADFWKITENPTNIGIALCEGCSSANPTDYSQIMCKTGFTGRIWSVFCLSGFVIYGTEFLCRTSET